MAPRPIARLHLITPDVPSEAAVDALVPVLREAVDRGARWVQVRVKGGTDRVRLERTRRLVEAARSGPEGATVVVDDRVDLALAVGAEGVHVGADDLPVAVARDLMGPQAVIGATCRNPEDARRATDAGADYVGVGPVFATRTKTGLPGPIGPAAVEAVVRATPVPVIAISGITVERVPELLDAGAHGIAVVAAVFSAPDPGAEVRRLLDALTPGTDGRPGLPAALASPERATR